MISFYARHDALKLPGCPGRGDEIDDMLSRYEGVHDLLLEQLRSTYNDVPAHTEEAEGGGEGGGASGKVAALDAFTTTALTSSRRKSGEGGPGGSSGAAAAGATASVLQVGTRIEAMFDGAHSDTGEWYQGVVAKVHDRMGMGGKVTHLYDVVYDDGDEACLSWGADLAGGSHHRLAKAACKSHHTYAPSPQ
jgi:hypothetical protein